jgi:signal recognition particle receptor subunit beta
MRVVVEIRNEIEAPQQALDVRALHAFSPSVNEPDLAESACSRFAQIRLGNLANFFRTKGMQIENLLDRNRDGLVVHLAEILCDTLSSMVLFNHATREMTAKIVYYGPGLCGKTTNLMVIFDKLDPKQKGKMLSLATKTDRTLFFDLLPVDVGKVGAFNLKMQLYTVPGQVFYNETRKLVLKGADAVVFVADSQASMIDSTKQSFDNLMENLKENQIDPADTPIIVQYNKRDIPGVPSIEALQEALGLEGYPWAEASALKGEGVMETFKLVSKITAKHLYNRLKGKNEPIDRSKPVKQEKPTPAAKTPQKPAARAPEPPPPEPEPLSNPFGDSMPFPESAPLDQGYEKMEEVSLEQLLEGRERPATISGGIPVPISMDDVEELDTAAIVEDSSPAVAVMEQPKKAAAKRPAAAAPAAASAGTDARIRDLEQQIATMRADHAATLDDIVQTLTELTQRVRSKI